MNPKATLCVAFPVNTQNTRNYFYMDHYINHWAKKILRESHRENPDDYKADSLDMRGDEYEDELKAREELEREDKKNKKEKTKEAMDVSQILANHKRREEEKKRIEDAKIRSVVVDELYDGYVAGKITFASGKTETFE